MDKDLQWHKDMLMQSIDESNKQWILDHGEITLHMANFVKQVQRHVDGFTSVEQVMRFISLPIDQMEAEVEAEDKRIDA